MSSKTNSTSSQTVVGDGGHRRLRPSPAGFFKQAAPWFAVLLIIAIVAVILHVHMANSQKNAAFIIDGRAYSKASISDMATYAAKQDGLTKAQEARGIFELYKTQVAAKKAGIVPNDSEMQAAAKSLNFAKTTTGPQQQYMQLVEFNNALLPSYDRYRQGGYEGDVLVFDFSQEILPPAPGIPPIAGHNDATLIAQDRKYAQQQSEAYYTTYKTGKSSITSLNNELQNKDKVGFQAEALSFDSSKSPDLGSQIGYPDIYKYVLSQTKTGLSTVRVGTVRTKPSPSPKDYADGYYYFVKLRKAQPAIADPSGTIAAQQQKLQTVYHGL
jgi:hypothetical protein